jgi:hypothetical protein
MEHVDDALVEALWQDLDGQVARQQIAKKVRQIAARFENATVTAFVPIFVRRQALEHLRLESSSESHPVASTATTDDGEGWEIAAR